jgi:hypothetical protein
MSLTRRPSLRHGSPNQVEQVALRRTEAATHQEAPRREAGVATRATTLPLARPGADAELLSCQQRAARTQHHTACRHDRDADASLPGGLKAVPDAIQLPVVSPSTRVSAASATGSRRNSVTSVDLCGVARRRRERAEEDAF